ncbi:hypothetical protein [Aeromicrobium sp. 179-A 4D2 NHS]|uniref:hypothetical protein n=1 Tax=Aeromicrobium sp. 179-A 4D2 NHS TaxID=3142375 RepID=UPI0039A1F5F6
MAMAAHGHHIHVMTRFRVQVLSRAAVLLLAGVASWWLPMRGTTVVDSPGVLLGSAAVEVHAAAALAFLLVLTIIGFVWQRERPADMGALAWVVAGGLLAAVTAAALVLTADTEGPMYWWLALGVAITSMTLQVLAALLGHGLAVLAARRAG